MFKLQYEPGYQRLPLSPPAGVLLGVGLSGKLVGQRRDLPVVAVTGHTEQHGAESRGHVRRGRPGPEVSWVTPRARGRRRRDLRDVQSRKRRRRKKKNEGPGWIMFEDTDMEVWLFPFTPALLKDTSAGLAAADGTLCCFFSRDTSPPSDASGTGHAVGNVSWDSNGIVGRHGTSERYCSSVCVIRKTQTV